MVVVLHVWKNAAGLSAGLVVAVHMENSHVGGQHVATGHVQVHGSNQERWDMVVLVHTWGDGWQCQCHCARTRAGAVETGAGVSVGLGAGSRMGANSGVGGQQRGCLERGFTHEK